MFSLYIYDHCPYCVKARMPFGLKHIPVKLITLLNDDVETPTRMIGQKMVPILTKEDGQHMAESMDIVHYIDRLDDKPLFTPSPEDSPIPAWLEEIRSILYRLTMPRWVMAPLEEFATEGARDFFTHKKEAMIGSFAENIKESAPLKDMANTLLSQLAVHIQSGNAIHGKLTEDDLHLFAALRSLSIVKGLVYPEMVESYRQEIAKNCGIPLHDDIAIG